MNKPSTLTTDIALRNQGIVNLSGIIDKAATSAAIESMLFMNELEQPGFDKIRLVLNSPGGGMDNGFQLTDYIQFSKLPVHITGLGICASMGILILCAGEKGHRIVTNNTTLLAHQYSWGNQGKYHELLARRKEEDRVHHKILCHYKKHSNLTKEQIEKFLLPPSDVWLSPSQAKRFGLIDKVI